jgi:hypothetical protein
LPFILHYTNFNFKQNSPLTMPGRTTSCLNPVKESKLGGYKGPSQVEDPCFDGNRIEVNEEGDPEPDDPSVDRET